MKDRACGREVKAEPDRQVSSPRTIMVVDDEANILKLVSAALTTLGYGVIAVDSGKRAIGIYHGRYREIAGVVLDYLMPEMDGLDIFREMKIINPEVKVLMLTGYGFSDDLQRIKNLGAKDILFKPIRLEYLASKVEELLS